MSYTTPGWIRRAALHACQLGEVLLVSGLIVFSLTLSAQVAEASPFVLHVKVSSGGGGHGGSGGDAGSGGLGPGATPIAGVRSTGTGSAAASASKSQVETVTTSASVATGDGPLGGIPIGNGDSSVRFPNTSPFGSPGGSVPQVTVNAVTGALQSGSGITSAGASPESMALLDLGNGDSLSVSKAVGDSLLSVLNPGSGTSNSNTDSVSNTLDPVSNGASAGSATGQDPQVEVPNLDTGLITYSGSLATSNTVQAALTDVAPIANPEPATLLLLGTGMILMTRRYIGRPKR